MSKKLSVSQNFITSQKLIDRIIGLSSINKHDTVIEIGTGKGHLTQTLCKKSGFVYSVELDDKLYRLSNKKLSDCKNLKLVHGDFLKYHLPSKRKYKVFANIPYSITSQIIHKLTHTNNPPDEIWLIVEKGAAKRFTGKPKETSQSLLLKVNWNMDILYYFRRNDFHPMPSVNSVLLHLSKKREPDLTKKELHEFRKFIAHSLQYGLFGKKNLLTKKQVRTALKLNKMPPLSPGGEILYIQWLCLFRYYQSLK